MLTDPDPVVQANALLKLAEYGSDAEETAPVLLALLKKGKDKNVRRFAALAVTRILEPEDAVPPLIAALKDPDVDVRQQAAIMLGELGAAAKSALPALEKFSKEPDPCGAGATAVKKIRE